MANWHISRQYIAQDRIVTEHWNRDKQAWQAEKGGKGYTEKGANYVHKLLFRQSYALKNLSVTSYRLEC
jgi:starvation-inducible outer membrane lipoprotein